MTRKIPTFTTNFYLVFGVFFLVWMLFLDSNDVFTQVKLRQKLNDLEAQKEFYQGQIESVSAERQQLLSNEDLLEKFAREQYLMKKPSEDLFIVVEEN